MPAYNPDLGSVPYLNWSDGSNGIGLITNITVNSNFNNSPTALMSQIKGGLHLVEFYEYLNENSLRGVSIARRELGMMAYVEKRYVGVYPNGAEQAVNKYYRISALNALGVATWEEMTFTAATINPNAVFAVATIAARNALPGLVVGNIVIVTDASGDTSANPAIIGSASYVKTADAGTPWLRFLYPQDPALALAHEQNTDTQLVVPLNGGNLVLTAANIYAHINDANVHFRINDASMAGNADEVYSSRHLNQNFLKKNPEGNPLKFFNELGNPVLVQASITRINGGRPDTRF